jgi:hypothetical protein
MVLPPVLNSDQATYGTPSTEARLALSANPAEETFIGEGSPPG